ncbi:dTDP-4-dehydrorhamnose 3,5-epimerase [Tenacibaculum sp. MAR_2009_124]|uniref:dTDP-4-dehydrorhamnose 3,5-epimerase n=1 Tax=Tenacibaculum sp. MAR_2009_124 TaxID=1250059 RepID=UPI00089BEECD|nr:dTDP-4-dehydrorhamnose 3,5-epimerase [Tenacibaculum sp. MAR_2009_124]SEC48791.1 dTDP-4-dehydrorhamnose 3,5-epimerase [Tenacibaculum sp. MAR_2009_124]
MKIISIDLKDCFIIEPKVFKDNRGCFLENFNLRKIKEYAGLKVNFVQDNEAFSQKGVLCGLHFQKGEHAQAKLVRVIQGSVLDVAVDLREKSSTYGEYYSVVLSAENKKQLFVPRGFAHGYSVLEDNTIFAYKCDNYYNKESEGGVIYNDSFLNINWMLEEEEIELSEKDKVLPSFLS